jgi:hypothetical protein
MRVEYRFFKGGSFSTWQALFDEAATFASTIPPERLIGISHDTDHYNNSTVTVWYWAESFGVA